MDVGLTRRNIGRLVLLAWAVMLAWLARREFAKDETAGVAGRTRRLEPSAQYFAVMAQGRQIGQLNLAADTLVDGVRLTEQVAIDLPVGDSTRQLARGTQFFLSRALRLRTFARTVFGVGPAERLDGVMGSDSILALTDAEGEAGITGQVRERIDPDALLPVLLPYRAAFGDNLHVGTRFSVPLIELGAGGIRSLQVLVAKESTFVVADSAVWDSAATQWVAATSDTIHAWRLDHDALGAPTRSWVDAGGALLRQETTGGLTLVRSAFEIVGNNYRRARRTQRSTWRRGIPGFLSLVGSGLAVDTSLASRQFLFLGDPAEAGTTARWLDGGRQSVRGDTVTVRRETLAPASIDETAMDRGPSWDMAVLNDGMRAAARLALAKATSARDSARLLTRWVAQQIATDSSVAAFGTALNTLRARRGNPDGKARLLATLARASGIPARVVSGIAVLPQGAFSHSWTELWLQGWVAADPTFGHFPASASLVRILVGERSRPHDLLPLVASARFLPLKPSR